MRRVALAVVVGLLVASGCSRDTERLETARAEPVSVSVGEVFELHGVELTVLSVEATTRTLPRDGGRESFPLLAVSFSAENSSTLVDEDCVDDGGSKAECAEPVNSSVPNVELHCNGVTTRGEPFAGSTVDAGGYLPMGAMVTGRLLVVFPPDPDEKLAPVKECRGASIHFLHSDNLGSLATGELDVDDEVIAAAIAAPIGPGRPLVRRAS